MAVPDYQCPTATHKADDGDGGRAADPPWSAAGAACGRIDRRFARDSVAHGFY
jgi:hypothetical protein